MSDKIDVPVTKNQIEQAGQAIVTRLRTMIVEMRYSYSPGRIAGMMSDLRALQHIQASDAGDAGIVTPINVDDREVRRKQQAAVKAADGAERKRLGAQ